MSVQIAKAAIREFLASDSQKVMSLKGGWGVGKTYAWKEALKAESQNTNARISKYSYVSLFGSTSLAMCLTKPEQWQYEKEWRVLSPTAGSQQIVAWALTGVILGTRISADDRRRVSEWVANREPRPLLSQVVLERDGYGVIIRDSR